MSVLSAPHFHDEHAAIARLESILWPHGPVCPHCANSKKVYEIKGKRPGLRTCGKCRKQFTVKIGTHFEDMHRGGGLVHLLLAGEVPVQPRASNHLHQARGDPNADRSRSGR